MSTTGEDYDSLSKEEREARDKGDREREEKEQAGMRHGRLSDTPRLLCSSLALHMEAAAFRCRHRSPCAEGNTRETA
jgi:hypothetical protein